MRKILLPGLLMALAGSASDGVEGRPAAITVDYPREGSIFPPEITPPTFLWRDGAKGVALWRIDVAFGDGAAAIHTTSQGARPRIGWIDPDCVADTNAPPKLTPQMAAAHSWTPDPAVWQTIKRHSVARPATVVIDRSGLRCRHHRPAQTDAPNGGGAFLDARPGRVADHQAAFGGATRYGGYRSIRIALPTPPPRPN